MDRRPPATPDRRDVMFCHQCDNEWYRDEHGFECPRCHGDFCEVIEAINDPRESLRIPQGNAWAPDPDEDDIEPFVDDGVFRPPGFRARFERTDSQDVASEQQPRQGGGLFGLLGSALRLASDFVQPVPGQNSEEHVERQSPSSPTRSMTHRAVSPDGTTVTRHMHGNGYSFTMTTTRSANTLQPRNPNNPQPFNRRPNEVHNFEELEELQQILGNIGAFPPGVRGGFAMGYDQFMNADNAAHRGPPPPFPGGLFQLLGLPLGGIHGDAVYSQEGLDRIISQLMEQHQTGNAPGPAPENAIKSLPQREITGEDLGESGTAECSICMEAVALGEKVTVLPCKHWFHYDCIEAWLSEHDTCPHCRQGITPSNDPSGSTARQSHQAPLNDMRNAPNTRSRIPGSYPQFDNRGSSSAAGRSSEQAGQVHDRLREAFGGTNNTRND